MLFGRLADWYAALTVCIAVDKTALVTVNTWSTHGASTLVETDELGASAAASLFPSVRCALQDAVLHALQPPASRAVAINALLAADMNPELAARRAVELVAEGFSTIKIKV